MFKVYICDPEKNTECKKTNCQKTCFSTLNPKYGKDYRVMRNEEVLKYIRQKLNERKISIRSTETSQKITKLDGETAFSGETFSRSSKKWGWKNEQTDNNLRFHGYGDARSSESRFQLFFELQSRKVRHRNRKM